MILGKGDDPYAVRTLLGWGILGPVSLIQDDVSKDVDVSYNRIIARKIGSPRIRNDRFVMPIKAREVLRVCPREDQADVTHAISPISLKLSQMIKVIKLFNIPK